MTRWQKPKPLSAKDQAGFFDPAEKATERAVASTASQEAAVPPESVKSAGRAREQGQAGDPVLVGALAANMRLERMVFDARRLIEESADGEADVTLILIGDVVNEGYAEACSMLVRRDR